MKISKLLYFVAGLSMMATSCSEFTPTGYTESPELPTANSIEYTVGGVANHEVNLSWSIPADKDVTGCILYCDSKQVESFDVTPDHTYNYTCYGAALGGKTVYTVKVKYEDGRISLGKSIVVELPAETLAGVSNLESEVKGRKVSLQWSLPDQKFRTGVRILINGDVNRAVLLPPDATSYVFMAQPMGVALHYDVEVVYDDYYYSPSATVEEKLPFIEQKMVFLLPSDATAYTDLKDDDELAAATWFAKQPNAVFMHPSDLELCDPGVYSVMWVMVDRVGIELGWQNLPGDIAAPSTIAALKSYTADGGSLYLSNMATQLTVPLNIVPDNMAPTLYGNGEGGTGDDIWTINPYLGWQFKDGGDQGFYDRTAHEIFAGIKLENLNDYPYPSFGMIGPGQREDHNCMWDCNIYGKGSEKDVIANFEKLTNSMVLATWGHVRDHCVAGLVDFLATQQHGRCVANGFAAYEWNQNSGPNPYQENIEKLTENILNYLK